MAEGHQPAKPRRDQMTETNSNTPSPKPSRGLKAGLLAGACAIAVVGAGLTQTVDFHTSTATAQTQSAPVLNAPGVAAPASFADVVERVRPAVVSVKVKVETASMSGSGVSDEDGEGQQGMPRGLPPGIEKFFKEFGQGQGRDGQGGQRFGQQQRPRGHQYGQAQGSGFFISQDGYIVT